METHQVVVILESVMKGSDPLAVSIHQDVPLFPETRRLHKMWGDLLHQNIQKLFLLFPTLCFDKLIKN